MGGGSRLLPMKLIMLQILNNFLGNEKVVKGRCDFWGRKK